MDEKLKNDFSLFLRNVGKEDQVPYAQSIIICDADKCTQYSEVWKRKGIPYEHGVYLSEVIPNAVLVTLEGAGHELHYNDWDKIINAISKRVSSFITEI